MADEQINQTQQNDNMDDIIVEVYSGVGKKSKKPFKALRVRVGVYQTMVFPTQLEMFYIEKYLQGDKSVASLGK